MWSNPYRVRVVRGRLYLQGVALSRYGGMRRPSEHLLLKWSDVDWEQGKILVHSPKTERHKGGESRYTPLFPELRPYLLEAFEQAEDGATYCITRYRGYDDVTRLNLRTLLHKIIVRAGLKPWPKAWHNLRATRQTELEEDYPTHVVCAWLGNSPEVARKHYLQVTDEHFARATVCAAQNQAQQPAQIVGNDRKSEAPAPQIPQQIPVTADSCRQLPDKRRSRQGSNL